MGMFDWAGPPPGRGMFGLDLYAPTANAASAYGDFVSGSVPPTGPIPEDVRENIRADADRHLEKGAVLSVAPTLGCSTRC